MRVTYFKTYALRKSTRISNNSTVTAMSPPPPPPPSLVDKGASRDESTWPEFMVLSHRLRERLDKNRKKLMRRKNSRRVALPSKLLEALRLKPIGRVDSASTIQGIPLGRYSNQTLVTPDEILRQTRRYFSNSQDPYFQIRNPSHLRDKL
jgi:hypothetical protein